MVSRLRACCKVSNNIEEPTTLKASVPASEVENEEERVTDNSTRETAWVVKIAQALEEEKGTIGLRVLKVNLGEASSPHL